MKPLVCKCGVVLSRDGVRWARQGHRVSRRALDGSPIVGTVGRPDAKGSRIMCRTCCKEAVATRKASITAGIRARPLIDVLDER